jgi:hypothetical protein
MAAMLLFDSQIFLTHMDFVDFFIFAFVSAARSDRGMSHFLTYRYFL